jgi:nucleoside-triphosphate--adenylate kinase
VEAKEQLVAKFFVYVTALSCGANNISCFFLFDNNTVHLSLTQFFLSLHALKQDFPKFHHVSTGDLLRQNVRQETALGKQAKRYMETGRLVPDELMIELVIDDATPFLEQGKSLLLDGFPRNVEQAKALDQAAHVDYIINLNVPTETIVERIADRWIHPASGRIYSYAYRPPIQAGLDDVTNEPLVQRDDDKPEAVRTRLAAYDKMTVPLVEWYQSRHRTIQTFTGTESDVIYPQVKTWLEEQKFS